MVTDFLGETVTYCARSDFSVCTSNGKVISIRANSRNYRSVYRGVHASSRKFRVDKTFRTVISYVPGSLASYTR